MSDSIADAINNLNTETINFLLKNMLEIAKSSNETDNRILEISHFIKCISDKVEGLKRFTNELRICDKMLLNRIVNLERKVDKIMENHNIQS